MKAAVALLAFSTFARGELPDCSLAGGWEQSGARRTYEGESLYEYMNGNSEGYLIYGFKKMNGVTCKKDGVSIIVDVSDMGDPESAFGIFSANRDVRSPAESIGMGAQVLPRKVIVAKGQYYLEIAAEPEADHSNLLRELGKALADRVQGRSKPPDALQWFPAAGMQTGSPRLIPQSVLGLRMLKRGYVAQYENGSKAFVVAEATPEAATATLDKLKSRLTDTADLEAGECGFVGKDKYLGTMAVFRKGPYVAGYASMPQASDIAALTAALAKQVK